MYSGALKYDRQNNEHKQINKKKKCEENTQLQFDPNCNSLHSRVLQIFAKKKNQYFYNTWYSTKITFLKQPKTYKKNQ